MFRILCFLLCFVGLPALSLAQSRQEVANALTSAAKANRIPSVLIKGMAWRMSRWQQRSGGKVTETIPGRVGIMGVAVAGRKDAERLRTDWRFNIEEGARQLALAFFRAPIIGNGRLEDGRNILECWYFALGRYGTGEESEAANAFADTVLDALATGAEGLWEPVTVSRIPKEKMAIDRNLFGPPAPWHFGDVPRRPDSAPAVSLPVPYLSQVWDSPDDFNGSGSCGPTSMTMVLAYFKKIPPKPIVVRDSYYHLAEYGGHIPEIDAKVCDPNLGAVHQWMLDYLRPHFPKVAIFYNEKATLDRVKRELDAHRPVILGTQVTSAGHLMVAKGYLPDGRLLVNDPAGDYYQAAVKRSPYGLWSDTGARYWNGDGANAVYDWVALEVRWVMTFGDTPDPADPAEDSDLKRPDQRP